MTNGYIYREGTLIYKQKLTDVEVITQLNIFQHLAEDSMERAKAHSSVYGIKIYDREENLQEVHLHLDLNFRSEAELEDWNEEIEKMYPLSIIYHVQG